MKITRKLIALNLVLLLLLTILPVSAYAAVIGLPGILENVAGNELSISVTSDGTYVILMECPPQSTSCGNLLLYDSEGKQIYAIKVTGNDASDRREYTYELKTGDYKLKKSVEYRSPFVYVSLVSKEVGLALDPSDSIEVTYGDSYTIPTVEQADIGNGIDAEASIQFYYTGTTRSGVVYSSDVPPTDAGVYTLNVSLVSATHNGSASLPITILPRVLTKDMFIDYFGVLYYGENFKADFSLYDSSLEGAVPEDDYKWSIDNKADYATLTITAKDSGNYTGSYDVIYNRVKKPAPVVGEIIREHPINIATSDSIDLSALLPKDIGTTQYNIADIKSSDTLDKYEIDGGGLLTYTTKNSPSGRSATITVEVEMENYKTATIAITIKLTGKPIPTGVPTVGDGIYYGQKLSLLPISAVMTVESVTIPGRIEWKEPDIIPVVSDTSAEWVFIPSDTEAYKTVTGTAGITVEKTTPTGEPTFTKISSEGKLLAHAELTATFRNPYNNVIVEGVLSWDDDAETTVISNKAYGWTFTPADIENYAIVKGSITPYVVANTNPPPPPRDATPEPEIEIVEIDVPLAQLIVHNAYIEGYPDATFHPNSNLTRAEGATLFYRLFSEAIVNVKTNGFTDVLPDMWFYEQIMVLEAYGIINGYEDGSYRPNQTITRAEFIAMAMRYMKPTAESQGEWIFTDLSSEHWAYDYICSAAANGYIQGYPDGTFEPDESITRAEAVAIVNRLIGCNGLNDVCTFSDVSDDFWAINDIASASVDHVHEPAKTEDDANS